jgi:hypothetical protein
LRFALPQLNAGQQPQLPGKWAYRPLPPPFRPARSTVSETAVFTPSPLTITMDAMDIHGWVEVSGLNIADRDVPHAWAGVIRLDYLIGWYDIVAVALFGFRAASALRGEPEQPQAVAKERGIPSNPSAEVCADLDVIKHHEAQLAAGEFGGYTHVYWEEVESVEWQRFGAALDESSPWLTVFEMVRVMRRRPDFANAGIRIVCWRSSYVGCLLR